MSKQQAIGSGFKFESTAEEVAHGLDLRGQTFVITGGHSGLGLETVRVLVSKGATVINGARNRATAAHAIAEMLEDSSNSPTSPIAAEAPPVLTFDLDLADVESVRAFSREVLAVCPKINVLINNAGIMAIPLARNSLGLEMQFATNHIGHFVLAQELAPAMERAASSMANPERASRLISLSSAGHRFSPVIFDDLNFDRRPYVKWAAYGQSKTANILFAVEFDRRFASRGIRAFAVHPGRIIETALARSMSEDERKAAMAASPTGRKKCSARSRHDRVDGHLPETRRRGRSLLRRLRGFAAGAGRQHERRGRSPMGHRPRARQAFVGCHREVNFVVAASRDASGPRYLASPKSLPFQV